ncbi:hypothetical protein LP420_11730 [Massilia sp. B-10]|nr:hypothetical protein LP420_11730 [Massilia sp. B-10]
MRRAPLTLARRLTAACSLAAATAALAHCRSAGGTAAARPVPDRHRCHHRLPRDA